MDREIAYLSLGSNLGRREDNLRRALELLDRKHRVSQVSSCFETEPVGFEDQPWFLNLASEIETSASPAALLEDCVEIERRLGRVRSFKNAPRILDIDILLFSQRVIAEAGLVIPHARMMERRFVLEPLAEIAPEVVHPVAGRTIRQLLAECQDDSTVRIYGPGGSDVSVRRD